MRIQTFQRLALGSSLCALMTATPALAAKAPTNAALAELVKAQAAEIADLKQRLSAVEAHEQQASAVPAAAPVQTAQQARQAQTDAQIAAATQDTKADEVSDLQARVAQLDARSKRSVKVNWKEGGPTFESDDGFFSFHPKGRIVADVSTTSGSSYHARNISGTEFRDLRLGAEGNVGKLGYNLDVDFAGNAVSVKEAYITYETKIAGLGSKTYLGNSLNDRSIEGATELVSIPFAERNAVASVAVPQVGYFGLGLQERLFGRGWHVSAAVKGGDVGDNDGSHNDSVAYFTRAHVNPILSKDAFIHVAGWAYYENLDKTVTSINKTSAIATDFNGEVRVSASSVSNVKADNGYGAELGAGWHSLWAFGEYGQRTIRVHGTGENIDQKAWTAYGGWFLTGERVPYASRSGVFTRPHVLRPVTQGGAGAFELLARYDKYDFKDAPRGGDGHAITVGGNWYLNDLFDLKLNYIHWTTDNIVGDYPGKDTGNTVLLRGEIVW
ncbi:OprO/OprP family phosphate-selective porin [Sphingomonas oryzagri]